MAKAQPRRPGAGGDTATSRLAGALLSFYLAKSLRALLALFLALALLATPRKRGARPMLLGREARQTTSAFTAAVAVLSLASGTMAQSSPPPTSQQSPLACVAAPFALQSFVSGAWTFVTSGQAFSLSVRVSAPGGWDSGGGNYIGLVDASYVAQSGTCNTWGCVGLSNGIATVLGISGSNGVPVHGFSLTMGTWCEFLACGLRAWGYDPSLSDVQGVATIPFLQTQGHTIQGGPGAVGLRLLQEWDTSIFQTSSSGYHDITVSFDATGNMTFAVDGAALAQFNAASWLPANATLLIGGSQAIQNVQLTFNCSGPPPPSPPPPPPSPPPLPPSPPPPSPPHAPSPLGICAQAAHVWPLNGGNDNSGVELDLVGGWNMSLYGGAAIDSGTSALYLSGSSAYGDFGNQTYGGNMSVALWVYLQTTNWCHILDFGNSLGGNNFILGPGTFQVVNTALSCSETITFNMPTNTWLHVLLTYDTAGNMVTYVNGVQQATSAGQTLCPAPNASTVRMHNYVVRCYRAHRDYTAAC